MSRVLFTSPIANDDSEHNRKMIVKIHKQFAHPSVQRLSKLIRDSGVDSPDVHRLIKEVTLSCEICQKYKRTPLRPAVGFPTASVFNETLAMDLKSFGPNIYILHIIDHVTRYSAACVIQNKRKETIVKGILEYWVHIFGTPQSILSDNGGEFVNEELIDFAEKFNIIIKTTAAESPWSNGLCEKHNGILGSMVNKVMSDADCSLEMAVHWATAAKNALSSIYGYSPNILVFGRNPNFPTSMTDRPPADNPVCLSSYLAKNLKAMHQAREAFIKQEACEKLRRALLRKSRTYSNEVFSNGDVVYYKGESRDFHRHMNEVPAG